MSKAFTLILFSACLGVVGQIFFKRAVLTPNGLIILGVHLTQFLIGCFFYVLSLMFYMFGLKSVDVHIAYPTLALGYILLFALTALTGGTVQGSQLIGAIVIMVGVGILWS